MSSGMPELGSKISLISKADIRYEGRLFTVDPQECTIALASVRSFGTEDRETQFPVAPQNQVYDYILFRGTDIKDIRVVNHVPSIPNDPAIMQLSVPPSLGVGGGPAYQPNQFNHPVVGPTQYPPYHPMGGLAPTLRPTQPLKQASELSAQVSQPEPMSGHLMHPQQSMPTPIQPVNQVKDQAMLELFGGGSGAQTSSRSGTPAPALHRKSPTADQGTQVGSAVGTGSSQQKVDGRRNSGQQGRRRDDPPQHGQQPHHQQHSQQQHNQQPRNNNNRPHSRNRNPMQNQGHGAQQPLHHNQQPQHQHQHQQHHQHPHQQHQHPQHQQHQHQHQHRGWRGRGARGAGRARGSYAGRPQPATANQRTKNTLKFENDYDFEQANTEFEELRNQLAKAKISDGEVKVEVKVAETEKKDDSGNETGAGEPEPEEDPQGDAYTGYDKTKSFFDNISCEAVERSKGRSQRTDWRTERKLNSETFGVATARRGGWRGRGGWRQGPPNQGGWRTGNNRGMNRARQQQPPQRRGPPAPQAPAPQQAAAPTAVAAGK